MTVKEFPIALYVKTVLVIIGLVAFVFIMYVAQGIIIPLVFATILAIVLHPAVNLIVRLKIHRVVAIVIVMLLTLLIIATFGTLPQASRFTESYLK